MTKHHDTHSTTATFDHDSTLVVSLELSGKSWRAGAVVPGVSRRPQRGLAVNDMTGLLKVIGQWRSQAREAGRQVQRVVLTYEAGRDGFWIARYLQAQGIEVHVMHPASIAMPPRRRRAKTDRIDVELLLRTFLAWLRGEPRVCTMAQIPSEAEEDMRRPGRERDRLVNERVQLENRITSLLCLHGITSFKPRLKKAPQQLETLRSFTGEPLPEKAMAELRRLMARHRLVSEQLKEIEAERAAVVDLVAPDRIKRMIQLLAKFIGLGVETATVLVHETFSRRFRNRRRLASFAGLTGTPFSSGSMNREQGISKSGNPRVRRILMQLAWRWLRHQPHSELSRWYALRTGGAKGRIRKIMIVAMARKLLIALWRYLETGELPAGVRTYSG